MSYEVWLFYLGTVLLLMSVPGPSHLLMLSNSMAHGFKPSLATAAGDLTANVLQMLAAGLGLASLVMASEFGFSVIKWGGVGYLLWLGIKQIVSAGHPFIPDTKETKTSAKTLWLQGFVTSAANPKAVVFFTALFPQFIDSTRPLWPQLLGLGMTYFVLDACFLASYGAAADWLAGRLRGPIRVWVGRVSGIFLIMAAILLGLKTLRRVGSMG